MLPLTIQLLAKIKDLREQEILRQRIEKLKQDPEKQGKPLSGQFKGYRSIRAVGQRYRIVYRIDRDRIIVIIVGVGMRREGDRDDIYSILAKKLEDGITAELIEAGVLKKNIVLAFHPPDVRQYTEFAIG